MKKHGRKLGHKRTNGEYVADLIILFIAMFFIVILFFGGIEIK